MAQSDQLVQQLVADAQALKAAGVAEGQQQATQKYFGLSAIRLMMSIFAASLAEAAQAMAAFSPDAAQFLAAKAAEFVEFATPPQVVAVSPQTDTANVGADDQVVLTFSCPLNPASVNDSLFTVSAATGGPALQCDIHYDELATVSLKPIHGFTSGVQYVIGVDKAVKSRVGQAMGSNYTSGFTVA